MLWTWILTFLIIGELVIYFLLMAAKRVYPYDNRYIPFMGFFYTLCLVLFIMAGASYLTVSSFHTKSQSMNDSVDRFSVMSKLLDLIQDLEMSKRGSLLTGKNSYLDLYHKVRPLVDEGRVEVSKIYVGTSNETRAKVFCDLVHLRVDMMDRVMDLVDNGKMEEARGLFRYNEQEHTIDAILVEGRDMAKEDKILFVQITKNTYTLSGVVVYLSLVVIVGSLVQIAVATVMGRSKVPTHPSDSHS